MNDRKKKERADIMADITYACDRATLQQLRLIRASAYGATGLL